MEPAGRAALLKAALSPLQQLAARSKSPVLNSLLRNQQDWEVLPDAQPSVLAPMTRPAFAHKLWPPSARAREPESLMSLLKAAQEVPPRDAAALTGLMVSLAAGRDSLGKQHTNHPGWRAMVQALNKQLDPSSFSAEQAVSVVSAAGMIGRALPAGTITPRVISQLIARIASAHSTFPASACASFMQGLSALQAPQKLYTSAAEAFLVPWLNTLTERPERQPRRYPQQLSGVLAACGQHGARLELELACMVAQIGKPVTFVKDYDKEVSCPPDKQA